MANINNKNLFAEVTTQESSTVSGGTAIATFGLDTYLFALGAGFQFGNPGLTPDEVQFAWENSVLTQELVPGAISLGTNIAVPSEIDS